MEPRTSVAYGGFLGKANGAAGFLGRPSRGPRQRAISKGRIWGDLERTDFGWILMAVLDFGWEVKLLF